MSFAWGWHLLIDCAECNNCINDQHTVRKFLQDLVVKLDMYPLGPPVVVYVDSDEGKGVSAVQIITTSTITIHGDANKNQAFIDVFSCKPYDPELVLQFIHEVFEPRTLKHGFIKRDSTEDAFRFEPTSFPTKLPTNS